MILFVSLFFLVDRRMWCFRQSCPKVCSQCCSLCSTAVLTLSQPDLSPSLRLLRELRDGKRSVIHRSSDKQNKGELFKVYYTSWLWCLFYSVRWCVRPYSEMCCVSIFKLSNFFYRNALRGENSEIPARDVDTLIKLSMCDLCCPALDSTALNLNKHG